MPCHLKISSSATVVCGIYLRFIKFFVLQGEDADGMYFIEDGNVKITMIKEVSSGILHFIITLNIFFNNNIFTLKPNSILKFHSNSYFS